jgi:hypothetical protein
VTEPVRDTRARVATVVTIIVVGGGVIALIYFAVRFVM